MKPRSWRRANSRPLPCRPCRPSASADCPAKKQSGSEPARDRARSVNITVECQSVIASRLAPTVFFSVRLTNVREPDCAALSPDHDCVERRGTDARPDHECRPGCAC
ncbi:hypothetical protein DXT77_13100 [Pseudomonas sp. 91RF]|nr:hypothetical protein DXT77_13100 [Pseudomonas sp. 91RF]